MAGTGTASRRVVRELTRAESLDLLGAVSLGRVVFTDRALPAIRPVTHLVDGGRVIIRSPGAAFLAAAERGVVVAYEADVVDPDEQVGWSVVVTGVARPVRDRAAADAYRERLRTGLDGPTDPVVAISADLVTGLTFSRSRPADREPSG